MSESAMCDAWIEAVREAYGLAKGERRNELQGRYVRRFDERGFHPYSYQWGRVQTLEACTAIHSFMEEDSESEFPLLYVAPETVRQAARHEAEAEYRQAILEEAGNG